MTYEEYMMNGGNNQGCGTTGLTIACIVCLIVFLFCSCATKRQIEYVDREVVKYNTIVVHDTLIQHTHDSVYHTVFQKGDTIYDTKYVEKTKWRDRIVERHDTCWRDSVVTEMKETTKEVVKYPKSYWYAVGISILFFIFAFVKFIRWLQIHKTD